MSFRKDFALIVLLALALAACSKRSPDPALQTALDELKRLSSFTEAGLSYPEYSDRLLNAKGNIDVALQRTTDHAAKEKIQQTVGYHLDARNAWKHKIDKDISKLAADNDFRGSLDVQDYWAAATVAANLTAQYVVADEATRGQIDQKMRNLDHEVRDHELALKEAVRAEHRRVELKKMAQDEARRTEEQSAKWHREAEQKRIAADAERQQEAEQKRITEEAERERIRRFAPEGIVYNLKRISVNAKDVLTTISPGTELKVTKKNSDGTLHVQKGDLATDVQPTAVTNDRDLATAVRSNEENKQESLRQWRAQQAAIAAEMEAQKYSQPTHSYPKSTPRYVNPLDRGPYRN